MKTCLKTALAVFINIYCWFFSAVATPTFLTAAACLPPPPPVSPSLLHLVTINKMEFTKNKSNKLPHSLRCRRETSGVIGVTRLLKTGCPPPPPHFLTLLLAPPTTTRHIRHSSSPPSRAGQGRSECPSWSAAPMNHSSLVKTLQQLAGTSCCQGFGCRGGHYLAGSVTPGGHLNRNLIQNQSVGVKAHEVVFS